MTTHKETTSITSWDADPTPDYTDPVATDTEEIEAGVWR